MEKEYPNSYMYIGVVMIKLPPIRLLVTYVTRSLVSCNKTIKFPGCFEFTRVTCSYDIIPFALSYGVQGNLICPLRFETY